MFTLLLSRASGLLFPQAAGTWMRQLKQRRDKKSKSALASGELEAGSGLRSRTDELGPPLCRETRLPVQISHVTSAAVVMEARDKINDLCASTLRTTDSILKGRTIWLSELFSRILAYVTFPATSKESCSD